MARFLLVRHGETLWNKTYKYQGQVDVPLNETGIKQAYCISERLKNIDIDFVYSSNLNRAINTAKIIAKPHGLKVIPTKEMRELSFGKWEGFTAKEIEEQWPGELERWRQDPFKRKPPGGENLEELFFRTSNFLKKVANKHPEKRIVIVTHAGTIRAILAVLLNLKVEMFWKFKISNASLTIIKYDGEADLGKSDAFIAIVNDTSHMTINR